MTSAENRQFSMELPLPRLGEFDLGGVLYHANYFRLLETLREEFLRSHQIPYEKLIADNSHLAVVETHQVFKRPINYGQRIWGALAITEITRATVTFDYRITSAADSAEPIHSASTKHAFVAKSDRGFRVSLFPKDLLTLFERYLVASV